MILVVPEWVFQGRELLEEGLGGLDAELLVEMGHGIRIERVGDFGRCGEWLVLEMQGEREAGV